MNIQKIEEQLKSGDRDTVLKGIAGALLLHLQELKKPKAATTMDRRPPENGDVVTMHCEECQTEKAHVFKQTTLGDRVISVIWQCSCCKNQIFVA